MAIDKGRFAAPFAAWTTVACAVATLAFFSIAPVPAQTPTAYKAPRTKDGKPNLNGLWQSINEANWDIRPHAAAQGPVLALGAAYSQPAGLGIVDGGEIPYKPEAAAKQKENYANRLKLDPEAKCYMGGVPRSNYMPYPFQIVQGNKDIAIYYEFAGAVRNINMGKASEAPVDTWMGWSNGHWDGETLVVDVTGLNGKAWFDRAGNFGSSDMKVGERWTATSPDTLMYEATITDPQTFTKPWKMSFPLYRRLEKGAQLIEYKCVEFAEDMLYGNLRKPGTTAPKGDSK